MAIFGHHGAGSISSNQSDVLHKSPLAHQSQTVLHTHLDFPFFPTSLSLTQQKAQTTL